MSSARRELTAVDPAFGFERRLRAGLLVTFVLLAALLVGFGVWLERPWPKATPHDVSDLSPAPAGELNPAAGPSLPTSLEVSR